MAHSVLDLAEGGRKAQVFEAGRSFAVSDLFVFANLSRSCLLSGLLLLPADAAACLLPAH